MTLSAEEFIRRFLLHVLPRGFQRIRQFGLLANRRRGELARCRQLLGATIRPLSLCARTINLCYQTVTGTSLQQCPACRTGTMKFFSRLVALTNYGAPHNSARVCDCGSGHRFIVRKKSRKTCHPSPPAFTRR